MRNRAATLCGTLAMLAMSASVAQAHAPDSVLVTDTRTRVAAVSATGAPRTLVTLLVPVPVELADAKTLQYQVEPRANIQILGRLEGTVQRTADGTAWRSVVLTLRVPSDARVGLLDVADVVFRAAGDQSFAVPIVLRVPSVMSLGLQGPLEFSALQPGDRMEFDYRVQNTGNDVAVVGLVVRAPQGWRVRDTDTLRVTVQPFSTADVHVALRVPTASAGGEYLIRAGVHFAGRDSAAAETSTRLRVAALEVVGRGIMLRPLTVLTATSEGSNLTAGVRMDGEVADGVFLRAQLLPQAPRSGIEAIALSNVGALGNPFQASLSSRDWTVDAGMVGAGLTPLTGINAVAEGVSARSTRGGREMVMFAGRSGLRGNATGSHVGAGMWWRNEMGRVGGSVSRMRETFGSGFARELSAIGADWSGQVRDWDLDAGLAVRQFGGGQHLGYRMQGERAYAKGRVRLGATHAPGGTSAFAAGVDDISIDLEQTLTDRWRMDASAMRLRDVGTSGFESRSTSVSMGHAFEWSALTSLSLRASSSVFEAEASAVGLGRFGSASHLLSAGATRRVHDWALNATGQLGIVGRTAELADGSVNEVRVLQQGVQLTAARSLATLGQLATGVGRVLTGAGAGQPTDVTTAFARLSGTPLNVANLPVRLTGDLRYTASALRGALVGLRVGAATPLPGGMELETSIERNPFFVDRNGRAGWMLAVRVSAATSVFSPRRAGEGGLVYLDRNGNGERDLGEEGVAGVRLRQGEVRVSSGRDGIYTVPVGVRGRMQLDPASVPLGLVLHPRTASAFGEYRDLPLVPTGVLTIRLVIEADADGRRPVVSLNTAEVWVVDADAREWVGRLLQNGDVRFENLPVGPYAVKVDLTRVEEPLRVSGGEEVLVIASDQLQHEVTLRGRTVRLIQPPGRGGQGTGRAGRSGARSN